MTSFLCRNLKVNTHLAPFPLRNEKDAEVGLEHTEPECLGSNLGQETCKRESKLGGVNTEPECQVGHSRSKGDGHERRGHNDTQPPCEGHSGAEGTSTTDGLGP